MLLIKQNAKCLKDYPLAAVGMADRGINLYALEGKPTEFKRVESPLKVMVSLCILIY